MEENAIRLIQNSAIDAENNRIPDDYSDRVVAIPSGYELHELERYAEGRFRYRGRMLTASIADFVSYVRDETRKGGEGFIDADKLAATVFFNLGNDELPGHGDYTATLSLKRTAAYNALLAVNAQKTDQRGLIDWLEDWSANLQAYGANAQEAKSLSEALAAIRQVSIKATRETENTEEDFRKARSTMEEIEARSKLGLPGGFLFTCEPYLGLPMRTFQMRLAVLTSGEKPILTLRVVRLEADQEAITTDFKEVLLREIGTDATMTIGTFTP